MAEPREYPRHAAAMLDEALGFARVVAITGARQTGKTTLARAAARRRGGRYVTMEDRVTAEAIRNDPFGMLVGPYPLVIDEFHLAGDPLLAAIKRLVDEEHTPGRFLLTGSAKFLSVKTLSESLAGRVRLIDLWPLAQGELRGTRDRFADRLFGSTETLRRATYDRVDRSTVLGAMCAGGYPEAVRAPVRLRDGWFRDYVRAITQRDVGAISGLERLDALPKLLRLLAARSSQEINLSDVSRDLGISRTAIDGYVGVLEVVGLWHRATAWSRNLTSKVVKHAKGYIADVGLAASLLRVDAGALADPTNALVGPLCETFVAGELARQRTWSEIAFDLHHFRDRAGLEVDLVLEATDGRIAAVEVKASASFTSRDLRGLGTFVEKLGDRFTNGVVLYLGDEVLPLGPKRTALPISALWAG